MSSNGGPASRLVLANAAWTDSVLQRMLGTLRRDGLETELLVTVDATRALALANRVLPAGNPLSRRLAKFTYDPPGRSVAPFAEAFHVAAYRLRGINSPLLDRRSRILDQAAARHIRKRRPLAFVGAAGRCTRALKAAREVGTAGILNLNSNPWERNAALERMAHQASDPHVAADMLDERVSDKRQRVGLAEIHRAHTVLVYGNHQRKSIEALGIDPARLVMLVNGVDTATFVPGPERDFTARPLRALFAGHVTYHKGVHFADAAARSAGPDVVSELRAAGLQTYGPRSLVANLRATTLLGELPKARLIDEYQRADVFVFPSITEAMARVVLEAMATGLPVITTHEAGYEDLITDGVNGFIVPSFESETIAARLATLARDGDLRRRMGLAARETAERCNWQAFDERFLRVFHERIALRAPSPAVEE